MHHISCLFGLHNICSYACKKTLGDKNDHCPHLLKKFKEVINSAAGTKIYVHIMSFFAWWLIPIFVPISCMQEYVFPVMIT
jgi:hypothetical protein